MGRPTDEGGAAFPRAPSQDAWDRMNPEERARVVESLPAEVTYAEMAPPEGDRHQWAKFRALDVLRGYFGHQRRTAYVGSELPVYYPDERRFAPDLLVVFDVGAHPREKWLVSHEGRGLDWVMEVHVGGARKKDAEFNVRRYARLGIPEYFIYDCSRERLEAYTLASPGAGVYVRMEPTQGRYVSRVLGLELELVGDRLRFWAGNALLMESDELIVRMRERIAWLEQRSEEEAHLREDEIRRREEESRRREDAERRVAELQAELERVRAAQK
ncbi:Uma2 family endonuclease [Myxococcus sp. AB036A]|uniref:Uma2 family endonuclease n=1 Tax=Myxococcus sp. AB036A TaxID=2562793 RepID=UPI0011468FF7|nr:Uma2 family endonuclease [Myxococcus sp. AB036A]